MFSAHELAAALAACAPHADSGYLVALSGGSDSCALLAAVGELRAAQALAARAVHVNHGLQKAAADFEISAQRVCARFGVPLTVLRVEAAARAGASVEETARVARYAALADHLREGECLLTAHHAEDQAETFLLQALRGAGIAGLAAMPAIRRFGRGWHARPLLNVRRASLRAYAASLGIAASEDPMNGDERFDRAYLRNRLWPLIERRWPAAAVVLGRSSAHAGRASEILAALARRDLAAVRDGDALCVPLLRRLPPERRLQVLREFIAEQPARPPAERHLVEALRQMLNADPTKLPAISWGEHALRRYRQRIYLGARVVPRLSPQHWQWRTQALALGPGAGRLRAVERVGGLDPSKLPARLAVDARRGGETIQLAPGAGARSVRLLCQESAMLPWLRACVPFVRAGAALIAVGDRWIDSRFRAAPGAPGIAIAWDEAPRLY